MAYRSELAIEVEDQGDWQTPPERWLRELPECREDHGLQFRLDLAEQKRREGRSIRTPLGNMGDVSRLVHAIRGMVYAEEVCAPTISTEWGQPQLGLEVAIPQVNFDLPGLKGKQKKEVLAVLRRMVRLAVRERQEAYLLAAAEKGCGLIDTVRGYARDEGDLVEDLRLIREKSWFTHAQELAAAAGILLHARVAKDGGRQSLTVTRVSPGVVRAAVVRQYTGPVISNNKWMSTTGALIGLGALLAACSAPVAAPTEVRLPTVEASKTPTPVKTPEPTKTTVPTATEAPKFVEYGSLLFGSVSAAEPKNIALAELADKKLKSSIESAAEKQLGLKVAEMGLWSARYDNGVGMVVVFKDNGDGTASQWMAFSQGSNGELLPVGSTDQIVFLQLYQIDRDEENGKTLVRIGFDEKLTEGKDVILPAMIMFTKGADGKIVGDVDMLYPFGQNEVKSIKVLASLIERFVPRSEVAVIAEQIGLPEGEYQIVKDRGVVMLANDSGELLAIKGWGGLWKNLGDIKNGLEDLYRSENLSKGDNVGRDGVLIIRGMFGGASINTAEIKNVGSLGSIEYLDSYPFFYLDEMGDLQMVVVTEGYVCGGMLGSTQAGSYSKLPISVGEYRGLALQQAKVDLKFGASGKVLLPVTGFVGKIGGVDNNIIAVSIGTSELPSVAYSDDLESFASIIPLRIILDY